MTKKQTFPQCCYMVNDAHPCHNDAEWDVHDSDPRLGTQSCSQHVGFLLEPEGGLVTPIEQNVPTRMVAKE